MGNWNDELSNIKDAVGGISSDDLEAQADALLASAGFDLDYNEEDALEVSDSTEEIPDSSEIPAWEAFGFEGQEPYERAEKLLIKEYQKAPKRLLEGTRTPTRQRREVAILTGRQNQMGPQLPEVEDDSYKVGGETDYVRALRRYQNMSVSIQKTAIEMILRPDEMGTKINTESINTTSLNKMLETFGSTIGGDPIAWAKELQKGIPEDIRPSSSREDIKTSYSMLALTGDIYATSGSPGFGTAYTKEQEQKKNEDLIWASNFLDDMTKKSLRADISKDVYANSFDKNKKGIMKKMLSSDITPIYMRDLDTGIIKVDENGEPIPMSVRVPLPIELEGVGTIMSRGVGANVFGGKDMGSGYTHLEFASLFPESKERDKEGNLIPFKAGNIKGFNLKEWQESEAYKFITPGSETKSGKPWNNLYGMAPSPRQSWFPTEKRGGILSEAESKEAYQEFKENYKRAQGIFAREALTSTDENWGNTTRAKFQNVSLTEDEGRLSEFYNEAELLGLERSDLDTEELVKEDTEKGTRYFFSGENYDVYGETTIDPRSVGLAQTEDERVHAKRATLNTQGSERARFIRYREAGWTQDQALNMLKDNDLPFDLEHTKTLTTDKEKYLDSLEGRVNHPQGSKGWLAQREGKLTASSMKGLNSLSNKGAIVKAANTLLGKDPVQKSDRVTRGNIHEKDVARLFKEHMRDEFGMKVTLEEAFFVENEKYEGFGVSPDAYVFDEAGKSMGLAEFKYIESESTWKTAEKDYMNQMQLQLAITEEDTMHFFRQLAGTKRGRYSIIKANPSLQKRLIETGKFTKELAEQVRKGEITMSEFMNKYEQQAGNQQIEIESETAEVFDDTPNTEVEEVVPFVESGGKNPKSVLSNYAKVLKNVEGKDTPEVAKAKREAIKALSYTEHKKQNMEEYLRLQAQREDKARGSKVPKETPDTEAYATHKRKHNLEYLRLLANRENEIRDIKSPPPSKWQMNQNVFPTTSSLLGKDMLSTLKEADKESILDIGKGARAAGVVRKPKEVTQFGKLLGALNKKLLELTKTASKASKGLDGVGDSSGGSGGGGSSAFKMLKNPAVRLGLEAVGVGVTAYKLASWGVDTQFTDVKAARELGMDVDTYVSMRSNIAKETGIKGREFNSLIGESANKVTAYSNLITGVNDWTQMAVARDANTIIPDARIPSRGEFVQAAKSGNIGMLKLAGSYLDQYSDDPMKQRLHAELMGMGSYKLLGDNLDIEKLFDPTTQTLNEQMTVDNASLKGGLEVDIKHSSAGLANRGFTGMAPVVKTVGEGIIAGSQKFEVAVDKFGEFIDELAAPATEGVHPYDPDRNSAVGHQRQAYKRIKAKKEAIEKAKSSYMEKLGYEEYNNSLELPKPDVTPMHVNKDQGSTTNLESKVVVNVAVDESLGVKTEVNDNGVQHSDYNNSLDSESSYS